MKHCGGDCIVSTFVIQQNTIGYFSPGLFFHFVKYCSIKYSVTMHSGSRGVGCAKWNGFAQKPSSVVCDQKSTVIVFYR